MKDHTEMWKTIRRVVTCIGIIVGVWLLIVAPVERVMSGARKDLSRGLDKVLGAITHSSTRVVEGRAEIVETTEISELSLLEMRMNATRTFENEGYVLKYLPTGTKKLIIRGHYQVKAGYRLKPGISLRVENGQPVARFPKPEILSVELVDFDVLNEESGIFNRIQAEDRAQVLRELREQMRLEAVRSGMLETVDITLKTRLRDLLDVDAVEIERERP
jgi:hypothetical protein